ncbi:MAG: hypothetical protein AAB609_03430 [Patescibacteria group bacterium]
MKVVVTHSSPDLDAITSVWLIKRFLPGWEDANIQFVPAGERIGNLKSQISPLRQGFEGQANLKNPIEKIGKDEVIHVDTGLGSLDHHQTPDTNICAASLTFDFVKRTINSKQLTINKEKLEALGRMVKVVVDVDHFKEVFWKDATADYHEFSLVGILDGLKVQKPDQDEYYVDFVVQCLDAVLHEFENRIWAEREIAEKGKKFKTRFGRGIGFETINDTVIKLSQKMGYVIVVRKDPRKGYVRVKAKPLRTQNSTLRLRSGQELKTQNSDIDLTLVYEKLKKIDPDATWFLHVGRKMLLNGSVKNPKMRPTKLSLDSIIKVLEKI